MNETITTKRIPEIDILGGSGLVSVEEKIIYNGVESEISKNREIYLDQMGKIEVAVKVVDYLGNVYDSINDESLRLKIDIAASDTPIIEVENVPTVVFDGEYLYLPDFNVYSESGVLNGVSKKVLVDGIDVTAEMKYLVNGRAGEVLTVEYWVMGDNSLVQTFQIRVTKLTLTLRLRALLLTALF